jgi:two-component system CheB/CheR fusion protein
MPVIEVKESNRVTLKLGAEVDTSIRRSIDPFFRSSADDLKDRAICIILSGTGTDGSVAPGQLGGTGRLTTRKRSV